MSNDRSVQTNIRILAGTHDTEHVESIDATVNSVDIKGRLCNVTTIGGKTPKTIDVRLMATVDDGQLLLPAIDSTVTIICTTFGDPYVTGYSEIEKFIWRGGDLGGIPVSPYLVEKLNNIENLLNSVITKGIAHTHNVTAVGSPTGPALGFENSQLTPTVQTDIENPNMSQG